ncbi:MAG: hypothetical protein WBX00_09090 [Isosphaeraceae bacterium]
MSKKTQDAEIAALAEAMLSDLECLHQQGGDIYPPKLRLLARSSGRSPTDDQILSAAGKKTFTLKAVVPEKVGRKPSLDSFVYLKGDEPPKKRPSRPTSAAAKPKPRHDDSELARRLLLVLESQRRLGAEAYPPLLRRIAELCELNASEPQVIKAASHKAFTEAAIVAARKGRGPSLDAPVILREDVDRGVQWILIALLRFALAPVSKQTNGKTSETTAFTADESMKRLVPELQKAVAGALDAGSKQHILPGDVGWVVVKGKPLFFLVENLQTGFEHRGKAADGHVPALSNVAESPLAPPRDFTQAFREAFEQLNRHNGWTNLVKLVELRQALTSFGRSEFDAGLRGLRVAGEFSLESHEGRHESLTLDERDAGIREAGSLLVYASRR